MRAPLRSTLIALALAVNACSSPSPPRAQPHLDAAPSTDASHRAAASRPRPVRLDPGCTCSPRPSTATASSATASSATASSATASSATASSAAASRAARLALVARMDQIHASLRHLMEELDPRARRDGQKVPTPLARWRTLRCRLDCLLVQFPGVTEPARRWQQRLAEFLDATRAVVLGAKAPAKLPRPVSDRLARQFNAVARASNQSIGFPLLARPPSPRPLALDALSFTVRARRQVRRMDDRLAAFDARWKTSPGQSDARLCTAPLAARVALHRLRVEIARETSASHQTRCHPDPACAPLTAPWRHYGESLGGLLAALDTTLVSLRRRDAAAQPSPTPADCSLSWSLLRAALDKRRKARARLAQVITASRRHLRPRPVARRRARQ